MQRIDLLGNRVSREKTAHADNLSKSEACYRETKTRVEFVQCRWTKG